ncbi:MAG: protein kinase [Deltaproteobacteria bacterium]|nr:protein kinase [Deltaproteobacteria bacterium]
MQPGDRVGDATVEHALGEGGFGRVYRARTDDGRVRAVKVAHAATEAMTTTELTLLQNEIEAVLRLRHPSLARTHGHGYLDDGRLYLVMDVAGGLSLIDHLDQQGPLDPLEALALVEQVAEVMAYCHEQGVLHLDLKPENILITDRHQPSIMLLDFGVAQLARAWQGAPRVLAGTPAYMAPECFGETARHPSMDVYALGVTLHVMLTGELAHDDAGMTAQIADKHAGPPPLDSEAWERVPTGLRALLRSMLAVDPAQRPTMSALRRLAQRLSFAALVGERGSDRIEITDSGAPQPVGDVSVLLGRDEELAALHRRQRAGLTRARGPTLLLGAQGIGKSAVLERFVEHDIEGQAVVAYGRCRESGELVPFAALREALGQLAASVRALPNWRAVGVALRRQLGPLEGVLLALVPEALPPGVAAAHDPVWRPGAEQVGPAVACLLEVVARTHPVVLVLEDLQWAGAGVHVVLQHLAAAPIEGVMLLLSARERPPWAAQLDAIELSTLAPADNQALIRTLLATDDEDVLARLLRRVPVLAAGIPMATVEVVADLQLQRCVRRVPGGAVVVNDERLSAYATPGTVAEVLLRRLDHLPPGALRVLGVGAMIGRRFAQADVVGTGMFGPLQVRAAVLEAQVLGLLHIDGGWCRLAHEGLRQRLIEPFNPEDARRVHAAIAEQLARRGADPGPRSHHLERAGQRGEAAQAHLEAARQALGLHAMPSAARHYRRTIELADALPVGDERLASLREAIFEHTRVAGALGRIDDAFFVVELGAQALRDTGDGDAQRYVVDSARARLHYLRGDTARAVALGRRCLAQAGDDARTRRYRVLPTNLVGRALYVDGRFGEAAVALARGCQLAAAEREHEELCHSLGMLGLSLGYTGVLDEARTHLDRASRLADELGDPVRRLAALCYAAIGAEYAHDWSRGVVRSAQALAFAREHEIDGLYPYMSLVFAGRHQFHAGHPARARLLLEHAIEVARRQGLGTGIGWAHAFLGDAEMLLGERAAAVAAYDAALQGAPSDEYAAALGLTGRAHCRALFDRDPDRFRADAEQALERLSAADNVAASAHALLRFADAEQALGNAEQATRRTAEAHEVFGRLGVEPVAWWPTPAGVEPSDAREHWQRAARATDRPAPSAELIQRVSQNIAREVLLPGSLQPRLGGMKPV